MHLRHKFEYINKLINDNFPCNLKAQLSISMEVFIIATLSSMEFRVQIPRLHGGMQ